MSSLSARIQIQLQGSAGWLVSSSGQLGGGGGKSALTGPAARRSAITQIGSFSRWQALAGTHRLTQAARWPAGRSERASGQLCSLLFLPIAPRGELGRARASKSESESERAERRPLSAEVETECQPAQCVTCGHTNPFFGSLGGEIFSPRPCLSLCLCSPARPDYSFINFQQRPAQTQVQVYQSNSRQPATEWTSRPAGCSADQSGRFLFPLARPPLPLAGDNLSIPPSAPSSDLEPQNLTDKRRRRRRRRRQGSTAHPVGQSQPERRRARQANMMELIRLPHLLT